MSVSKQPPAQTFRKDKAILIKDLKIDAFCDLTGEVLKMYYPDYSTMDLYITDYTENKDLYMYLDPNDEDYSDHAGSTEQRGWTGPSGQMSLQVRLWEPHASWARSNLKVGDIVFLQNVRGKLSNNNTLEGALHQDMRFPSKICVHKCSRADQLAAQTKRKIVYEEQREKQQSARRGPTAVSEAVPEKVPLSKKARKQEKKRIQKETEQQELRKKAEAADIARKGINPHIRAAYPDIQLSTVTEIVNNAARNCQIGGSDFVLPFVNCKYRTRIRVIDFWPNELLRFACRANDPQYSPTLPDSERRSLDGQFDWCFVLLVEDADASPGSELDRLRLNFGNAEVQSLLKMDPCDLSKRPDKLKELEEKLFIVWGNLCERKLALAAEGVQLPLPSGDPRLRLQNKPFECCIKELGEDRGGNIGDPQNWIQRFVPFSTTVMD